MFLILCHLIISFRAASSPQIAPRQNGVAHTEHRVGFDTGESQHQSEDSQDQSSDHYRSLPNRSRFATSQPQPPGSQSQNAEQLGIKPALKNRQAGPRQHSADAMRTPMTPQFVDREHPHSDAENEEDNDEDARSEASHDLGHQEVTTVHFHQTSRQQTLIQSQQKNYDETVTEYEEEETLAEAVIRRSSGEENKQPQQLEQLQQQQLQQQQQQQLQQQQQQQLQQQQHQQQQQQQQREGMSAYYFQSLSLSLPSFCINLWLIAYCSDESPSLII